MLLSAEIADFLLRKTFQISNGLARTTTRCRNTKSALGDTHSERADFLQRAYDLYAADLAIWLWTILFKGESCQPYNVGSEDAISIKDAAYEVAAAFPESPKVLIAKSPLPGRPADRYVPSIKKVRESLGLDCWIKIDEALRRTIKWNQG